jgi:hypothetical protein
MLLYCVGWTEEGRAEAVTIGMEEWLQKPDDVAMHEDEILAICRPRDPKRVPAFNSYVEEMKAKFPRGVNYETEEYIPEHVIRRKGYWENTGWK